MFWVLCSRSPLLIAHRSQSDRISTKRRTVCQRLVKEKYLINSGVVNMAKIVWRASPTWSAFPGIQGRFEFRKHPAPGPRPSISPLQWDRLVRNGLASNGELMWAEVAHSHYRRSRPPPQDLVKRLRLGSLRRHHVAGKGSGVQHGTSESVSR